MNKQKTTLDAVRCADCSVLLAPDDVHCGGAPVYDNNGDIVDVTDEPLCAPCCHHRDKSCGLL